jgi:DNA-binding LacI/PurR family transcriptional regulator
VNLAGASRFFVKTQAVLRPVDKALAGYENLIRQAEGKRGQPFPTEKVLAAEWGVSQAAVNRAALRLIAAGRLRREGYKLLPVAATTVSLVGARLAVLSHRAVRFPGIAEEAARRGVRVEEFYYIGRDTLRNALLKVIQHRYDGVITRATDSDWEWDTEMAELDRLRIPYVVAEEAPAGHNLAAEDLRNAAAQLVGHLFAHGHREIACICSLRRLSRSGAVRLGFEEACLRLGLTSAARNVFDITSHTPEAVRTEFQRIRRNCPLTSAVVLFDPEILKSFVAAMRKDGLKVARDLSIVVVGDSAEVRTTEPPVTCVSFDPKCLAHLALDLVCQQMLEVRRLSRVPPRQRLRLEGTLRERSSVETLQTLPTARTDEAARGANRLARVWPHAVEPRLREAAETWQWPHRLVEHGVPGSFAPIDLSALANRSLRRPHGWLGHLPLLHLGSGLLRIHGVDFSLLDERANRGRSVVVLRSSRFPPTSRRSLPDRLVLPVGRKVRAVYFLHGCGYAGERVPFAWYEFCQQGRAPVQLPLVARGVGPAHSPDTPPANIQDWWPEFPQFNADGVRHVAITENGDPFAYERYLYSLEWVNPDPDVVLDEIRVRSNPVVPTTLGLLAVTLLVE